MLKKIALITFMGMTLAAAPAVGQINAANLVNVNVSNVANDIARDLDINVSEVPVTVQVPVDVAANVCNVDANVLTQAIEGGQAADCSAENTTEDLNQIVQRQLTSQ